MSARALSAAALALLLAAPAAAEVVTRTWEPQTAAGERALLRGVAGHSLRAHTREGGTAAGWARENADALRDPRSANWAAVAQAGQGHEATVAQGGAGNVAAVVQVGRGASATVAQTGGQSGLTVQWGR